MNGNIARPGYTAERGSAGRTTRTRTPLGPIPVIRGESGGGRRASKPAEVGAERCSTGPPAAPRAFTVHYMPTSGTVFEAIHGQLLARSVAHFVNLSIDTTPRPKAQQPCCCRVEGVNVFLGDKPTAEAMVEESRTIAMRRRRVSNAMSDMGALCVHQRKRRADSPDVRSARPDTTICNYILGLKSITLKARMVATLSNAFSARTVFEELTPQTFTVYPRKAVADERHHWIASIGREHPTMPENMWIIKSSHGCKGSGICLLNAGNPTTRAESIGIILDHIDGQPAIHPWVVQRYVARPLLINKRKFDLRAWVLITPRMQVLLFKEIVCRMSSEPYEAGNLANRLIHLTNHCLQEKGPNYGKYERGNELPSRAIDEALASMPPDKAGNKRTYASTIRPQLADIVIATLKAARETVVTDTPLQCFQLLGYDFIIDDRLKVWLLEVNGSPGVADFLLKQMAAETIALAIDPFLLKPEDRANLSSVEGFEEIYHFH